MLNSFIFSKFSDKIPTQLHAQEANDPNPEFCIHLVDRPDAELFARVAARTQVMLNEGWIEETKRLRALYPNAPALRSVGYAQILDFLDGIQPAGRKLAPGLQGMTDEINLATRQLIKTQRTFFRGLLKKLPPADLHIVEPEESFKF